ncbi:class I SAM-dependent methyltransferase [Mycolicibacterium sp. S2-37]|uniref:class I SAM-dependent methyltransferase n=1 Tax=Mycolicibacterium sp. S2-37 TaxID=2810297 RepID=UPI001F5EAE75
MRRGLSRVDTAELPAVFAPYADEFPCRGTALDIACGQGRAAVWLAQRGIEVWGVDVSPVAVAHATELARAEGVAQRCRFSVADLDDGLPQGPAVDVVVCHLFRDPRLDQEMISRLAAGGLLAVAALSEVDAERGPYRARPGELQGAFAALDIVAAGEGGGIAWLLARRGQAGQVLVSGRGG